MENESEITGILHNAEDESHQPDQISEGKISWRDMKVPIDSHPEGSGGDVRVMTVEGRQTDANLHGLLAAADDPVDDGLRHGHGLSEGENGVKDINNCRTLDWVTGPAVSSPMGPAEIDCYLFRVGFQGAQRNNDRLYCPDYNNGRSNTGTWLADASAEQACSADSAWVPGTGFM